MEISTESKPQRLNFGKRRVLSLVNGQAKRNVLIPKRIRSSSSVAAPPRIFFRSPRPVVFGNRPGQDQSLLFRGRRAITLSRFSIGLKFSAGPQQPVGDQAKELWGR